MSFLQFSEYQYIKEIDTNESVRMGGFQTPRDIELSQIKVLLYIHNVFGLGGQERARLKIYSDQNHSNGSLLYTSEWSYLNEIPDLGNKGDWIGWFPIIFNRQNISDALSYYTEMEMGNYTRDGQLFYCGLSRDFPYPVYDNGGSFFYDFPLAMAIFGYVERDDV